MYECYCGDGFYLHSNGYNCIGKNPPPLPPLIGNLSTFLSLSFQQFPAGGG